MRIGLEFGRKTLQAGGAMGSEALHALFSVGFEVDAKTHDLLAGLVVGSEETA